MEQKLSDVLKAEDEWIFTESKMKQLLDEYSGKNELSNLLSMLYRFLGDNQSNFYSLYKTTIIIKHLCDQTPEESSNLLHEQKNIINSIRNYSYVDSFGRDLGANVKSNVEQLLDFIALKRKPGDCLPEGAGIGWTMQYCLDSAADQLQQTLNSISKINTESILQRLRRDISNFNKNLPGPVTSEKFVGLDKTPQFDAILYGKIVETIVDLFDDNWPMLENNFDPHVERLIVIDGAPFSIFHESLIVLTDALKKSANIRATNSIALLLEKLIKSEALFSAITEICNPNTNEDATIRCEEMENAWQKTLQILVSLPNRIANKLDGKVANTFLPDTYAGIISVHIGKSLLFLNAAQHKFHIKPRVNMLSMLISKAVIVLGAHRFENLFDIMSEWCSENSDNMRHFIIEILRNIDRQAIQPIAVSFLKQCKSTIGVDAVFGDLLSNPHWKHVFAVKLPLMSYYDDENLMRNLIAYLSASSSNNDRVLPDLLIKLLDIWGDRSALNHTSFKQHEYITKLIIMALREVKEILLTVEKDKARNLLLAGTSAHLESTQVEVRIIGMVTGEVIIEMLNDSDEAPKLKYEYEGMPVDATGIIDNLRKLAKPEKCPKDLLEENRRLTAGSRVFDDVGQRKLYELAVTCKIVEDTIHPASNLLSIENEVRVETNAANVPKTEQSIDQFPSQNEAEDLDSDDDLVPYDMSNDTPISEKLRPTYLRDLKENLLNAQSNTDPNIFAESMKIGEELILSQLPNDDTSFGMELLEILLTLRENSYVENFELLKFKACVAVVLVCPKDSANYLCNKFHTKINEYSINDRLFMLNVLSESARKLSKIEIKPTIDDKQQLAVQKKRKRPATKRISLAMDSSNSKKYETLYDDDFEVSPANNENGTDWEEIVSKRIQSNTRRFAHPSKSPVTTMNRFNDVAASFFYPLLYGFRQKGTCLYNTPKAFEDQENILLVHYLKTLSTMMVAAENCVIVPKMAKEILDLAWSLRYHKQAKVRLCVIENTASVVITLPKEGLTPELMELIYEFRAWLADVSEDGIRGDPDKNCRTLGKNVVALIDSVFHSTLNEL